MVNIIMLSRRQKRLKDLLREEIGLIIRREMSDRISSLLTITEVEISKDLSSAKVYVSFLDGTNVRKSIDKLQKAGGFIRSQLNKVVRLKRIPKLNFVRDDTIARAFELEEVFEKIRDNDEPGEENS